MLSTVTESETWQWLAAKRRHVLSTLEGLDDEQGLRVVVPSGWSMVGAVHHLALDVERFWFARVLAGDEVELAPGGAWRPPEGMGVADVIALYSEEISRADEILAAWDSAGPPRWWWPDGGPGPYATVSEILHHVLSETAVHAGHLDVVRELIDGHQHAVIEE